MFDKNVSEEFKKCFILDATTELLQKCSREEIIKKQKFQTGIGPNRHDFPILLTIFKSQNLIGWNIHRIFNMVLSYESQIQRTMFRYSYIQQTKGY